MAERLRSATRSVPRAPASSAPWCTSCAGAAAAPAAWRSARAAGRATPSCSKSSATGPSLRGVSRAAAFFDLDRTLMAGSSAFAFAREAYRSGLMSRRQIAADGLANLAFRLQGSTDQSTDALRDRVGAALAGIRVRDIQRMGPGILGEILPRVYPRML